MSAKKIVTDALKTFGRDVEIRCARHHPTLFSTADMELDDLNFLEYSAARSKLFDKSFFRYVPPKDFNYQLPSASRAETCFIGRSNVGKSSLIECLSGGRGIAKVSKSPGCTKTLNFFAFIPNRFQSVPELTTDHHRAYLVDMPGYGYAKVSREEQQRWLKVMNDYLLNRDQTVLRRSYLLIDSRHGLKPSDVDMMVLLNRSFIPYQLIFTKSDLVKESDLVGNLKSAFGIMRQMKNASCLPLIHAVSSTTGSGIQSLQLALAEIYADTRYNSIYDGEDAPDASTPAAPAGGSTTVQQSPKPK